MKLTVSKSKNSATFYVQKSIRKSNGSVTTVTIEKLGNADIIVYGGLHLEGKMTEIFEKLTSQNKNILYLKK